MPLGQSLAKLAFWLITIAALINLTGPPTRSLFEQFLVGEAKRRHGTEPSPLRQTGGALHPNPGSIFLMLLGPGVPRRGLFFCQPTGSSPSVGWLLWSFEFGVSRRRGA